MPQQLLLNRDERNEAAATLLVLDGGRVSARIPVPFARHVELTLVPERNRLYVAAGSAFFDLRLPEAERVSEVVLSKRMDWLNQPDINVSPDWSTPRCC